MDIQTPAMEASGGRKADEQNLDVTLSLALSAVASAEATKAAAKVGGAETQSLARTLRCVSPDCLILRRSKQFTLHLVLTLAWSKTAGATSLLLSEPADDQMHSSGEDRFKNVDPAV